MATRRIVTFIAIRSNTSLSAVSRPCFAKCRAQLQSSRQGTQELYRSSIRWHTSRAGAPTVYNFSQIKHLSQKPSPERVIIDVREPAEYEAGYIPGAINMPIKSQPDAIFLPEDEFEDRFGFSKPEKDQEVIFYCKAGVRSSAAAQLAQQQGYSKISEYRGSWMDWEKNGGPIQKP